MRPRPGADVHVEVRIGTRQAEALAGPEPGEGAIDQNMSPPVESECLKVDSRNQR